MSETGAMPLSMPIHLTSLKAMSTFFRLLWFALVTLVGILVGLWAHQLERHTPPPIAFSKMGGGNLPKSQKKPLPAASVALPSANSMTIEEMDVVINGGTGADGQYRLHKWLGGDSERSIKCGQMASDYSCEKNYESKLSDLFKQYYATNNKEERRSLYHEITRQRLYCMSYDFEVARRANLLVGPVLGVSESAKDREALQGQSARPSPSSK